jgi:hypothetical protein
MTDSIPSSSGTNLLKSLGKSSNRRSTQRVCNDFLLRFGAHSSALSSGKTIRNGPRGCYGFSSAFMPRGMTLRAIAIAFYATSLPTFSRLRVDRKCGAHSKPTASFLQPARGTQVQVRWLHKGPAREFKSGCNHHAQVGDHRDDSG